MLDVANDEFEDSLEGSIRAVIVNRILKKFYVHCLVVFHSIGVRGYQADQETDLCRYEYRDDDSISAVVCRCPIRIFVDQKEVYKRDDKTYDRDHQDTFRTALNSRYFLAFLSKIIG